MDKGRDGRTTSLPQLCSLGLNHPSLCLYSLEVQKVAKKDALAVGTKLKVCNELHIDRYNTGRLTGTSTSLPLPIGCILVIMAGFGGTTSPVLGPFCEKSKAAFYSVGSTHFPCGANFIKGSSDNAYNRVLLEPILGSSFEAHLRGLVGR